MARDDVPEHRSRPPGRAARTVERNGLILLGVWAVLGGLTILAYNSALAGVIRESPDQPMMIGPTLAVSPLVSGVVAALLYLASFVVVAVALRTFVTDETETVPGQYVTRILGWMLLNLIVGYVVYGIAVGIGTLLLVVPGIILFVSLFFWFVRVIVEDENFVAAFRGSWELTKGNRLRLFALGLVVTVVGWILTGIPFAIAVTLPQLVALVIYGVTSAIYGVFSIATVART